MWQYNYSPSNGNDFLAHAGQGGKGFKYVRKYRGKNGKWIYVYKNSKGATKKIHDTNNLINERTTRIGINNDAYDEDYYRSKASAALTKHKFKKKAKKAAKPTAKSIAKAVGKSSKAITKRYKTHEIHDYVPVHNYRSGKNEEVRRVRKFKRAW